MNEERRDKYVKWDKYVKIKGKEIILTNKDWRTLLERFDPSNIQHLQNGYCYMNKPCICDNYKNNCSECPFGKLGINGCWKAIKTIEPNFLAIGMFADMNANYMKWRSRNCSKVKNMLIKIYVALREMGNYYETKPYVIDYTKTEPFYIKYVNYHKKNDFPREITFSPRMYGQASRLTATEMIELNRILLKIRSIENELDKLKHLVKFYTEEEGEDMMEWRRKERAKRGMPF